MNKTTKYLNLIFSLLMLITLAGNMFGVTVSAQEVDTIGNMEYEIGYVRVDRVETLESFFDKYNSPLKGTAPKFVEIADKYNLDYTLLPSISCMESTCGKHLIEGSNNPFGWGVYGDQYIAFESYEEAIEVVGEGLYEGYFSKGFDTPAKIAPIYTPPNSQNWYRGVNFFSNQINEIALDS